MKEFDLFSFQVEIDETATREWYDKVDEWCCDCEDCRHFMSLAKRRELPSTVIEILEQFGFLLIRRFKTIGSFNNTSSKFRLLLTWQLVKIERIQEVSKMNVKGTKKKN